MTLPFKFISCLGHGGFGVVLKAQDKSKNTYSAVKIIFPSDELEGTKSLKREFEIMEGKHDRNVVKVLNVTKTVFTNLTYLNQISKLVDNESIHSQLDRYMGAIRRKKTLPVILIEMELCGATLRKWLFKNVSNDKEDLSLQFTQIQIIKDMVSGMQFLHENKIIHRDFKPENVMFSLSNVEDMFPLPLKIGDFGLCRILHSEESNTSTLTSRTGTFDYRAPEMDGNEYNFQSDIYSLGLVIWEVIQLIPFKGRKKLFNELVYDDKTELVVSFEPSISSTIISMTKRKFEDRMQSIIEVDGINDSPITLFKNQLDQLVAKTVRNGQEFKDILLKCSEGDVIHLTEGEFEGPFKINCSNLKIIGQRSKTVLKCHLKDKIAIEIRGNNNCVSNIDINYSDGFKLIGSDNSIFNVGLIMHDNHESTALKINGSRNKISGLKIFQQVLFPQNQHAGHGIFSNGDNNTLENIEISDPYIGIGLIGSKNTVTNVIFNNTIKGIKIDGSQNKISTIKYIKGNSVNMNRNECCGVTVCDSENDFEDIQCTGMRDEEWGLEIVSDLFQTKKCKISNSSCGPLLIRGGEHTLVNVDCGPLVKLEGMGHKLIECKGQKLSTQSQHSQTLVLEDNNFDEVV